VTDEFRHRTRVEVRFRDLDAFGHVNNAVTTSYVEHGRISYFRDVLEVDPVGVMPLILAMIQVDYERPIVFGGAVEIRSRMDSIGRTSLAMSHHLSDTGNGLTLARARSVLVAYDYTAEEPMPVPEDWRMTLTAYEGRDLGRAEGDT
jgi:acyl-CoA thioester hydrolase